MTSASPRPTGAGTASFAGAILSHFAMGPACNLFGPPCCLSHPLHPHLPAIVATSLVSSTQGFVTPRFLVEFSLANFVSNQLCMSSVFGWANGVATGWAEAGSSLAQLVMPLVYSSLPSALGLSSSPAWRLSLIYPAIFQALTAVLVLVIRQDRPPHVEKQKSFDYNSKDGSSKFLLVLLLRSGAAVDNILAQYFYDRFGLSLHTQMIAS
ncbi:hypothetical protein SAY86_003426 [Trapa natans]|uniref:Major facilitator superfamily (MFS) profile domain-containing protein n=1 Tax=Trapa natans TaxID=22666 RepID=A0AAN7ME65_TRANT|nr:hypothetical protein SAY86_003426 [Trapa natans]